MLNLEPTGIDLHRDALYMAGRGKASAASHVSTYLVQLVGGEPTPVLQAAVLHVVKVNQPCLASRRRRSRRSRFNRPAASPRLLKFRAVADLHTCGPTMRQPSVPSAGTAHNREKLQKHSSSQR